MWTVLGDGRDRVGESPVWDAAGNALWWVDTWGRTVNRHRLDEPTTKRFLADEMVGGVVLAQDGGLLALMETGLFRLDPVTSAFTFLSAPADLPVTHRFNDVTVDPAGRLIAGTMRKSQLGPEPTGVLYAFDGIWRRVWDGFWTVNGLAFSPDGETLYVSDSHPSVRTIWSASYDLQHGVAGPRRAFVDMSTYAGRPDGAAVDVDGGYWIAGVGGGSLYRFDPDGRLSHQHAVPVERPTKPAFGGPGLADLFITSMSANLEQPDESGLAGACLRSSFGIAGVPVGRVRI